jgi:REP element-mobilizing transposase RayT
VTDEKHQVQPRPAPSPFHSWDYASVGAYFVTICTQDRQHVFGEVVDGEMRLNDASRMALWEWEALPRRFPTIDLDAFVIMPNHVHGIIVITQTPIGATTGATTRVAPTVGMWWVHLNLNPSPRFCIRAGSNNRAGPPFVGRLWQRNDYEHIIRDARELEWQPAPSGSIFPKKGLVCANYRPIWKR